VTTSPPLFQQRDEEQERLTLQSDSRAFLLEFAIAKVDFEKRQSELSARMPGIRPWRSFSARPPADRCESFIKSALASK